MISTVISVGIFCSLVFVLNAMVLVKFLKFPNCERFYYILVCLYNTAVFCFYFILWLRTDAVFYRQKMIKQLLKKWIRFIHILCLVLLVVVLISILILERKPPQFYSADCKCLKIEISEQNFAMNIVTWAYYMTCVLALQFSFLFSFAYPLYLHKKYMHQRGFEDVNSIMPVMKRAAIVGIVLIVSDLILLGFVTVAQTSNLHVYHTVISINLLVNTIATIMSFANWKGMLIPFQN